MFPVRATTDLAYEASASISIMDTIVDIFPSNFIAPMSSANMLQLIVMALIMGFALLLLGDQVSSIKSAVEQLNLVFTRLISSSCSRHIGISPLSTMSI